MKSNYRKIKLKNEFYIMIRLLFLLLIISCDDNPVDTHIIKQIPNGNYMGFLQEYQLGPIASDN